MNAEYVVIVGPPASGKTLNSADLKEHFKCDHVFDAGFEDLKIAEASGRILVLATDENLKKPKNLHPSKLGHRRATTRWSLFEILRDASIVTKVRIEAAALAIGDRWVEPIGGVR